MKRLGMIELHRRQGDGVTRILIPAEMVGPVAEVPGNDTAPPQCRVTLRGRSYWEDILVLDTIDEIARLYRHALSCGLAPGDPREPEHDACIACGRPYNCVPARKPRAPDYEHEHAFHPEAIP